MQNKNNSVPVQYYRSACVYVQEGPVLMPSMIPACLEEAKGMRVTSAVGVAP